MRIILAILFAFLWAGSVSAQGPRWEGIRLPHSKMPYFVPTDSFVQRLKVECKKVSPPSAQNDCVSKVEAFKEHRNSAIVEIKRADQALARRDYQRAHGAFALMGSAERRAHRSFHELRVLYPPLLPHLRQLCQEAAQTFLCAEPMPDPQFRNARVQQKQEAPPGAFFISQWATQFIIS